MKKILIAVAVLAIMNTFSCSEKKNSPAPESSGTSSEDVSLTVATTIDLSKVKSQIINNMSCDINIKYYPYSEETDSFELLYLDMISGEDIDVVYSTSDDIAELTNQDYMTDMYPLMEQSETLTKEDFLPNVLAGLEIDGKLPAICDDWQLFTAVAKTENVGENMENWTPAQAFEAFNNMPEDMTFLNNEWQEYDRLNYLIKRVAVDAVDYKNNTCDFGGAFMDMINSVNNLPAFQPYTWGNDALINNHTLVEEVQFFGINSSLSQQLYAWFGGADITFVGYPSESGKGYITDVFSMFGILENSSHKQQGYEFISLMLNNSSINTDILYSLPITEKQLTEQLNTSKYNNLSVHCPQYLPDSEEQIEMPDEAINQAVDYIRNVEFEPYMSNTVEEIIFEEYHKCFDGETTPQECVDMLNNRVSLYLGETE